MELLYLIGIMLFIIAVPSTYYTVKRKEQLGLYKKTESLPSKQKRRSDIISYLLVGMGVYCISGIIIATIFSGQIQEPYFAILGFSIFGCILVALPLVYTKKYWDVTDENYIHKADVAKGNEGSK